MIFTKKKIQTILLCLLCSGFIGTIWSYHSFGGDTLITEKNGIPIEQADNIVQINDNHGNIWPQTNEFDVEIGETLIINVQWTYNVTNATLKWEHHQVNTWVTYQTRESTPMSNNTIWSNFELNIPDTIHRNNSFTINAFNASDNTPVNSNSQKYYFKEPALPSSVPQPSIKASRYNSSSILINWTAASDNVGVAYYEIYRYESPSNSSISESNAQAVFNSTTLQLIDNFEIDPYTPYFYAIRAVDYVGQKSNLVQMVGNVSVDNISPSIIEGPKAYLNKNLMSSGFSHNADGILLIQIRSEIDVVFVSGYFTQNSGIPYSFNFSKRDAYWEGEIDLSRPRSVKPIAAGTYDLVIIINDKSGNQFSQSFSSFMIITEEEPKDSNLIYYIIGIVGVVAVLGFVFLKKRKNNAQVYVDSDLEISEGPAKRKRGKVYSGASSIGRASGKEAELLQEQRGVKTVSKSSSKSSTIPSKSSTSINQSNDDSIKLTKKKVDDLDDLLDFDLADTKKLTSPLDSPSIKNEKTFDELPVAQQMVEMKKAESGVDTLRRIDFSIAKLNSIDQNLLLMNLLLNQTAELESVPKTICPKCGQALSNSWGSCPYCLIDQQKDMLKIKSHSTPSLGIEMICPTCRKLLQPTWTKCPFCLTRRSNST